MLTMLREIFEKEFERNNRIVPFKLFFPVALVFFVGGIIFLSLEIDLWDDVKRFHKVEINNSIDKVIEKPQMICYKMDKTWYFIAAGFNAYLQEGDSISKEKDSYYLRIYNKQRKLKWQGEVKGKIFFEISGFAPVSDR